MREAKSSLNKLRPQKKTQPISSYGDVNITVTFGPVTDRPGITIPTKHYRYDRY